MVPCSATRTDCLRRYLPHMDCPLCGEYLLSSDWYCPGCGQSRQYLRMVREYERAVLRKAYPPPTPTAPSVTKPAPKPSTSAKIGVTLLGVILGAALVLAPWALITYQPSVDTLTSRLDVQGSKGTEYHCIYDDKWICTPENQP